MKIITLSEQQFNEFSYNHKYSNLYQTTNYAKVMKQEGYDYHLLGFANNSNDLIGATMILFKKGFFNYKIAYAPFGFLIDYSNNDLIEEITNKLRKLLIKQKFIFLKINPKIHCSERDKKGNIIAYNPEINDILEILQKSGYNHSGFNNFFETEKPRWNAILKLTSSNEKLYKNLNKQTRNKINKAIRCGVEIQEGKEEDIDILYEFIKKKHSKSLNYYKNILKEFREDAKIYLAKINTQQYVSQSKDAYEKELEINEQYNDALQENTRIGKDITTIINKKMESDKRLANFKSSLAQATNYFAKYPNGLTIGGLLAIKHNNGMNLIIEGFNQKYREFNCNYLLKWKIIQELNLNEYRYFNLNGIVGEFKEINKYSGLNEMKLGYNASAVEYIGEFELVINRVIYNIYQTKLQKRK